MTRREFLGWLFAVFTGLWNWRAEAKPVKYNEPQRGGLYTRIHDVKDCYEVSRVVNPVNKNCRIIARQ
jgi:hypothetical protein